MKLSLVFAAGWFCCGIVFIGAAASCDPPKTGQPHARTEYLDSPNGYEITVVHDDKRGITCYVTGGTGGGLSCVRDPIHHDAGVKP